MNPVTIQPLSKNLFTCKTGITIMTEQIEDMVKISSKGQIVIPKCVREKLGLRTGEKLIVVSRDDEILLRKTKKTTIEEIAKKIEDHTKKESIDVDQLIDEAIEWARRSK
jgi:antitoxin PrlF